MSAPGSQFYVRDVDPMSRQQSADGRCRRRWLGCAPWPIGGEAGVRAVTENLPRAPRRGNIPLILYSPVSWLFLLLPRMLNADDALDPTVSTRSKPGCAASERTDAEEPGRWGPSWRAAGPGRRAKGLRIGIVGGVDMRELFLVDNGWWKRESNGLDIFGTKPGARGISRFMYGPRPRLGQACGRPDEMKIGHCSDHA